MTFEQVNILFRFKQNLNDSALNPGKQTGAIDWLNLSLKNWCYEKFLRVKFAGETIEQNCCYAGAHAVINPAVRGDVAIQAICTGADDQLRKPSNLYAGYGHYGIITDKYGSGGPSLQRNYCFPGLRV